MSRAWPHTTPLRKLLVDMNPRLNNVQLRVPDSNSYPYDSYDHSMSLGNACPRANEESAGFHQDIDAGLFESMPLVFHPS